MNWLLKKIFIKISLILICYTLIFYSRTIYSTEYLPEIIGNVIAEAIIHRQTDTLVSLTKLPCNIRGQNITSQDRLQKIWEEALEKATRHSIKLLGVKTMPYKQAKQLLGEPPARINPIPQNSHVSIIYFNRFLLIFFLVPYLDGWKIVIIDEQ